jgi:glutathione S-transferase
MEEVLAGGEYLAGPYSYADVAFYMAQLFGARMGAEMTEETPRLLSWRARMTARPAVRTVVGPMAGYIVSQRLPLPGFLSRLVTPPAAAYASNGST